jgi:hypothetical protein
MADGIEFRLNTTEKDARWVSGSTLQKAVRLDANEIRAAVERSMQPGLASLRQNVQEVGTVTGRLRRSPAIVTRRYGRAPRLTVMGLVGYRSGVAPHARLMELGTPPRAGRGLVKARRLAWKAFFYNRDTMSARMQAEMEALLSKAVSAAAQ